MAAVPRTRPKPEDEEDCTPDCPVFSEIQELRKLDTIVKALDANVTRLSADVDGESRIFSKRNITLFFIFLIPIVINFASVTWSVGAQAQAIEKVQEKQEKTEGELTAHELAPAPHPVVDANTKAILEALNRLEAGQAAQVAEIKEMRVEQKKTTRYVDRLCDKAGISCQ